MKWTRDKLLLEISNAALFGSFGLFVGTGFSKDMTDDEAPSFDELLKEICKDLKIKFNLNDIKAVKGKSYPRIAQEVVSLIRTADKKKGLSLSLEQAEGKLKRTICKVCDLEPNRRKSEAYRDIFRDIPMQWIITTNYDFLLEDTIPNSVYLLPEQLLNERSDFVPIYHLHGHRRAPASIVVTESDYIGLMGPTEYRQLKLNLLMTESTTLMLGYSLGDINVKVAVDWSQTFKNTHRLSSEKYQSLVVQALYVNKQAKTEPYVGDSGEVIIEITDICEFLEEVVDTIKQSVQDQRKAKLKLKRLLTPERRAALIAENSNARQKLVSALGSFPRCYDVHTLINFLNSVLDPIWQQARSNGGFVYYDRYLNVLLDVLINLPFDKTHPSLLRFLSDKLDDVSSFMDPEGRQIYGTSWDASRTWRDRKDEIPADVHRELLNYSKVHGSNYLERLLKPE